MATKLLPKQLSNHTEWCFLLKFKCMCHTAWHDRGASVMQCDVSFLFLMHAPHSVAHPLCGDFLFYFESGYFDIFFLKEWLFEYFKKKRLFKKIVFRYLKI